MAALPMSLPLSIVRPTVEESQDEESTVREQSRDKNANYGQSDREDEEEAVTGSGTSNRFENSYRDNGHN